MEQLLQFFLWGILLIGVVVLLFFQKKFIGWISVITEFLQGWMMAVCTFYLLPDAIGSGGVFFSLIGLILGSFWFLFRKKYPACFAKWSVCSVYKGIALGVILVNHFSVFWYFLWGMVADEIICFTKKLHQRKTGQWVSGILVMMLCIAVGYLVGRVSPAWNAMMLSFGAGGILFGLTEKLFCGEKSGIFSEVLYISGLVLGILLK